MSGWLPSAFDWMSPTLTSCINPLDTRRATPLAPLVASATVLRAYILESLLDAASEGDDSTSDLSEVKPEGECLESPSSRSAPSRATFRRDEPPTGANRNDPPTRSGVDRQC